jgi:L-lactate dehydrogenase complex protein LldG
MHPVTTRHETDDRVGIFLESLRKSQAEPYLVRNREETTEVLKRLLQGTQSVVLATLPPAVDELVPVALDGLKWVRVRELTGAGAIEVLSRAEIGMTWARFGIASHGTLVEVIQDDAQKLVSCLPRVHIALLSSGSILPDFVSTMKEVGQTLRASPPERRPVISLITGPSRTSDIESRLLYGVHGPLALKVLILDWTVNGELHD